MTGYVAKDKDGEVYLYEKEPYYDYKQEGWFSNLNMYCITEQFPEFNNMSYKDKPIKVEIKLERI